MKGKILIIDDTKNIRILTQKALVAEDYEVDLAENGFEGIKCFQENRYDLILLDIRMPYLSGTEVLKSIRDIDHIVPVIIITAYPTVKNAVDCLKLGAVDYLRKPFTTEKIKQIVDKIMERKDVSSLRTDSYEEAIEYSKKCINERKFDEAVKFLKKAVSINIEEAEPFNIMGNLYEIKEDYEAAYKYYNIALQFEPLNENIIGNLERIKEKSS